MVHYILRAQTSKRIRCGWGQPCSGGGFKMCAHWKDGLDYFRALAHRLPHQLQPRRKQHP